MVMAEDEMRTIWSETNIVISTFAPSIVAKNDGPINFFSRVNDILSIKKEIVRAPILVFPSSKEEISDHRY